jgi:phosphohistidine phosphatase
LDIILWRHAEAEDGVPGSIPDAARKLTAHGRRQAHKMAKWLLKHLPGDCVILVSPAVRTQQTVAALGLPFTTSAQVGTAAAADGVLRAAREAARGRAAVLVVGHQPTLGELAAQLLGSGDTSLKKGAIVWIEGDAPGSKLRTALAPAEL